MDVSQYLEIFLDETKEHLQNLNTQILELESDSGNMNTINEIFRAAHSLKGMAGTMGYKRMQALTHDMENVFSEVRNGTITVGPNLIDILFQCLDALEEYTDNIQNTADEGTNDNAVLIKQLGDILSGEMEAADRETNGDREEDRVEEASQGEVSQAESPEAEAREDDLPLDETQHSLLREAAAMGMKAAQIHVTVSETCILKAARAFLVFKALEEYGDIVVSQPSAQDVEDEKFDREFTVLLLTGRDLKDIIAAAANVSEIEDVQGFFRSVEAEPAKEAAGMSEEEEQGKAQETDREDVKVTEAVSQGQAEKSPVAEAQGSGREKKNTVRKPVVNRTVRVDIEKLDVLMNLVSELIIAKNSLVSVSQQDDGSLGVKDQISYLESVTTNLHESVMKVRMVPIESVVSKFPRMIRDLSKKLGKQMELYMTGEETELDRTVVDEIGDPLMHLLRNSADHGLETAEVRAQRGKPAVGSIYLDAYQDGNNVVIEVRDDGNGIDVDAVRDKAIERGTITAEQAANMEDNEIINLLFLPSFSTAKSVTDVSGRGVGLDVVRSKIESLSGEVEVKTKLGQGSCWTIRLPLTLAIIQALMVVVGGEKYAISLESIQTIEDIPTEDVKLVQNKEVILLRGSVIPLIRLRATLDLEPDESGRTSMIVVIVKKGDKMAGLVVDDLIGQQEIVIKSLGKYIKQSKFISGATILGDGEVALILDANALI